jgi:RNA polymerase sigma-70 factor (ECF subfamily)
VCASARRRLRRSGCVRSKAPKGRKAGTRRDTLLKRWISSIVVNSAKTQATRERRSIPFSAVRDPVRDPGADPFDPSVGPERFRPDDAPQWPGGWMSFPRSWDDAPDECVLSQETQSQIRACIDALPASQREVVVLRDVHGFTAEETCTVLQISEVNQRVLLQRGRSKVRRALELHLTGT